MATSSAQVSDSLFIVCFMFFVIIALYFFALTELDKKEYLGAFKYAALSITAAFFTYILMKEPMLDFFSLSGSGIGFAILVLITFERLDWIGYMKQVFKSKSKA